MPKMKNHSGAAKRFRKTAKGFKHRAANRNHILTKKAKGRLRNLRGMRELAPGDVKIVDRMLPTGEGK